MREKEEFIDIKWFYIIQDFFVIKKEDFNQSWVWKVDYYEKLRKYIKMNIFLNNMNDDLKYESLKYELWDDILYNTKFKILIIIILKNLIIIIKVIYKDLNYYEKWMTLNIIR